VSKERARARAAREAVQAAEREQPARTRARQDRRRRLRPGLPALPTRRRRPRRYGALPTRLRLGLGFGWLVLQWLFWQFTVEPRTRLGLAVLSLLALPLLVVLVRTPSRGSSR
jgi:hypothetical protein